MKKRCLKKKYKFLIAGFLALAALVFWSRYISTSGLVIKEYKIVSSNLPASFEGLKIIHFTDVHYGRTINKKELEFFVQEINILKPDLIFFTGDLIDKDTTITVETENEVISILSELNATIGKYAVRGNHDVSNKNYNRIMSESGFIDLANTHDIIYSSAKETIFLAGLDTGVKGKPNINSTKEFLEAKGEDGTNINEIPKYKILLVHTPDTIAKVKTYKFDLVLAGHSHNGQIRLPIIGPLITPVGAKRYYNPYYKVDNTDLYISGGLGTSTISFRFLDKPSFNFYRLVKN